MKNSNVPEGLELPDWSAMRDPDRPVSPAAVFELCEEYYRLFPEAAKKWERFRRDKCTVEFVLDEIK